MNFFDLTILHFFSAWTHRNLIFDTLIVSTQYSDFVKGAVPMALVWWAWSRQDGRRPQHREQLLLGLVSCVVALALARGLALALPFRVRPLHNPLLHFQIPYGMDGLVLEGWSAFPSDHAVLFFCLATILWIVSRKLGIVAMLYAFFIICLPRVYMGLHYPTDILVGGVLGCAVGSIARIRILGTRLAGPVVRWGEIHPGLSYALLFLISFEFAELFNTARTVLHLMVDISGPVMQAFFHL